MVHIKYTAWDRIPAWACEKVASDLELGGGFAEYSDFPNYIQLTSHELAKIGINVTKNEIPNSKFTSNSILDKKKLKYKLKDILSKESSSP